MSAGRTPDRRRWRAWLAALATLALGVALGVTALGSPAEATHVHVRAVTGASVTRFVQRDAAGRVTARGATATLRGTHVARSIPVHPGGTRVATARRGHPVLVTHLARGASRQSVTAHR